MLPKPYWHDMTSPDFAGDTSAWIAVLPVCAIEQHGPHLPVYTDTCIAEGCIRRSLELMPGDLPVTVLPVQAVGKSNEHISSPGTLTLSWNTVTKAWIELGECVHRAGIRKLVLINSHGGNVPIIDIVARELRVRFDMLCVATGWFRFGLPDDLFPADELANGIHGGEVETAMMLHLRPDLVKMDEARDFHSAQRDFTDEFTHLRGHGPVQFGWKAQDLNPAGVVGNAAIAKAAKGAQAIEHQCRAFVDLLKDLHAFDPGRLWKPDE